MKTVDTLRSEFEHRLEHLLSVTKASRVTLRLEAARHGFHVDEVVTEARRSAVPSLMNQTSINQRQVETVRWLDRERRLLIQNDLTRDADPAPPKELVSVYGTKAQMLAPLVWNGELVGWISVHDNEGPREWSKTNIEALEEVAKSFHESLSCLMQPRLG